MSKPAFDRTDDIELIADTIHNRLEIWLPGSFVSFIPLPPFQKQRQEPVDPFPKIPDSPQLPNKNPNPLPPEQLPGSVVIAPGQEGN